MSKINFDISGKNEDIKLAVKKILEYVKDSCIDITDDMEFDIKVIANEVLTNSIKHFSESKGNKINIMAGISSENQLYLVVKDDGSGFDYSSKLNSCEEIDYNLETIKECGRGLLIIKNLCECVKFNKKGNKIVILKNLDL